MGKFGWSYPPGCDGPPEPEYPEFDNECPECGGEGTITADEPGVHDLEVTCLKCGGSGYIDPPEHNEE